MRVLVMSITAGEGHNAAAKAICRAFEARGNECLFVDAYKEINRRLYGIVSRGYLFSVSSLPRAYSGVYTHLEKRKRNSYRRSVTRLANRALAGKIRRIVEGFSPDVIVYTHCFCGVLLDVLREREGLSPLIFGVLTDFVMHPYWEECLRTDYIVVAGEASVASAERKGFRREQILPFGIPIREEFSVNTGKSEARRLLGLREETTTLLLMGGSMGYGDIKKSILSLDRLPIPLQLIAVCGSNARAEHELNGLSLEKPALIYGYTDKIGLLMDAADAIVTKPGGLTLSEALAKRLPLVLTEGIPGIEARNAELLLNNGAAIRLSSAYPIETAVRQLLQSPVRLRAMQDCIDCIRHPYATDTLCRYIENCVGELDAQKGGGGPEGT